MLYLTPYTRRHQTAPYDPFAEMDRLERAFFGDSTLNGFLTDIQDEGDHYLLEAELPGFKKEDIKIDLDGDCMTISATRQSKSEEKKKGMLRQERSYGSFRRSFDVSDIDADNIGAAYEDGVLKLTLPKKQPQVTSARRLEIK
ncbi:MAG: Hsp20/alpha crystallin family protein [Eubacteriales bacterium]|nr:Hsp20/alpha crystallin family protein [Eubacteriales bacterium]